MGADRVTNGPVNAAGTNPDDSQAILLDRANNILEYSGAAQTRIVSRGTLATIENTAPITAVTTAQTLLSYAIAAGMLASNNRRIRVKGRILYNTTSTNVATITIALLLGTTTIVSIATTATNTAASVNLPVDFEFDFYVVNPGVYAAILGYGALSAELGSVNTTAVSKFVDGNQSNENNITIGTNPAVGDTINVMGTTVTFIVHGGTPAGNQVALGTTATLTATALYTFLAASADANIAKATWTNPSNGVVLGISNTAGAVPWVYTSVPAKIAFSIPIINVTAAQTLSLQMTTGVAAIPSATVMDCQIEITA